MTSIYFARPLSHQFLKELIEVVDVIWSNVHGLNKDTRFGQS